MRRVLSIILVLFSLGCAYAQTNPKVKEMENQRNKIEQEIAESKKLLTSSQKDIDGQLAQLSALTAQIKKQKQFVDRLDADVKAIDRELAQIEAQLRTLQIELERRREHYAHALRLMTHKNTFENRLMFLLSAESFNQMVRRTRYLREYSGFQQKQGEELMEKQKELDAKRAELGTTKEAKKELLAKRVEEKKELDRQEAEQRKIVDGFKKKQTEIRKRIAKQQRERDKLNEQINRLIEEEIAAQEAEMRKKNGSDTPTPTKEQKAGTPMPTYRESAADKKLSGKNVKINNHGVDIRGHMNCQARAVFDGTVSAIFEHPQIQGSYIVMIRHGQYISAYFNLSELKVKKGEKVKINEPLGLIKADMSGNYTMQFQLRRDRERLNPEQWIGF